MRQSAEQRRAEFEIIAHPSAYRGQPFVLPLFDAATSEGELTRAAKLRLREDWIEFFSRSVPTLKGVTLWTRVPQQVIDSLSAQPQLESLTVKWGPYADLSALSSLMALTYLSLGGASKVTDISPLATMSVLEVLALNEVFLVKDRSPLGELRALRELTFGTGHPGNDRSVVIEDLEWTRALSGLEVLSMPGTRFIDPDLSPLLDLENLTSLNLPLRRSYRRQVFEFASHIQVFASLAESYTSYEDWARKSR